ncbi:hypothetical protein BDZ89DRAFT_1068359 [Hymenopellis radicata]|nr:hypothetical protein BDZ89DRAFT_1068359 [Hymenopellis radicata]
MSQESTVWKFLDFHEIAGFTDVTSQRTKTLSRYMDLLTVKSFTIPLSWIFTEDEEDYLDMDNGVTTHSYAVELAFKGALSKAINEFPEYITLPLDDEIDPRPAYQKRSMTSILPGFLYVPGTQVSDSFAPPPPGLRHASKWPSELSFEWSIALMIQLHRLGSPQSTCLPEWCVLLGIVYTVHGVRVYGHYPRWRTDTQQWQYSCGQLTRDHVMDLCAPFLQHSTKLSSLLFTVQRHTYEVETHLRELVRERAAELDLENLSSIHV